MVREKTSPREKREKEACQRQMMIRITAAQVCDARDDAQRTGRWQNKIF